MASISDVPHQGNLIVRAATAFWNGLVKLGEAGARTKELERLAMMSDEDLAKRGLRREDIVLYVYRDRMAY
ncbi:DUF1127 domain-containing protein [Shimia ponticola]|uniref:DUF1127 domain-containing protein n=1 Tax=Shimia ponticola TaxID=2582893 RepID=UPI0011BEAA3E|nr:DUF1127 domain-containing protein [Shimia ponticola]